MKQCSIPVFGKLYLQFSGASLYLSAGNLTISAVLLWQVSGASWAARNAPWLSLPLFLLFALAGLYLLMNLHWMLVERAKNEVAAKQSFIEENPAVQTLVKLEADMKLVKQKLGIEDAD